MPMPAVLGTIAQQGQAGGGAPSGVSIATSSAGNYDNAILVECATGPGVIDSNDGSQFSSNIGDISLNYDVNYNNAVIGNRCPYGAFSNETLKLVEEIIGLVYHICFILNNRKPSLYIPVIHARGSINIGNIYP